jgi:rhodanese-related sulfurtransferase
MVQASGGHWTNVTPDKLASMLEHKGFTLLNVKTPYIGESAIAAQTLIDLGYTNIDNLEGGMNAWSASGRTLVQMNRS